MRSWNRLGLRARILLTLGTLVLITVGGGLVMIWYTYRVNSLLTSIIQTNLESLQVAKGLETALLNQRGYVSYYFLDGDPGWLKELGKYRQEFDERLKEAGEIAETKAAREAIERIGLEYSRYTDSKDQVIELYR
ncbi:MAG: MCP four helix bundle domain-containing protein, partial [Candidatus Hydrogenedentota bacterium]